MQQRRRLNAVRHRPTLAITLTAVLVMAVITGVSGERILNTQQGGGDPVPVAEQNVAFHSGDNVVVDDPAIATQGQQQGGVERTVKEFTSDDPFSMFALTWEGERDIAAFVRAEAEDGSWGPWYDAEPIGQTSPSGKNGTDLVYVEPTTRIQVSATGIDFVGAPAEDAEAEAAEGVADDAPQAPAPAEAPAQEAPVDTPPATEDTPGTDSDAGTAPLPSNYGDIQPVAEAEPLADDPGIEVVLIDGNAQQGGIAPVSESDTYGMPDVISRAGWGANEGQRCSTPTIDNHVSAITIHHTAGSNDYSEAQAAGRMRGYYTYHASTLGWCDIGYQALVDKYGNIYEGRAGGLNKAVRGAHAGGFNQNTWAISMMGNYQTVTPSPETIQAVGDLAGWRASVDGFEPKGNGTHYSEGSGFTPYPAGQAVNLPNIFAHRDVGNTACPGDAGYAQMGNIRDIAQAKYDSIQSGQPGGGSTPAPTDTEQPGADVPPATTPRPGDDPAAPADPNYEPSSADQLSSEANSEFVGGNIDIAGILAGDTEATVAAAGTLAVIALGLAVSHGDATGETSSVGDVQIAEGVTLGHIQPLVDGLVSLSGDSEISETWRQISSVFGPVLGDSRSGVQYAAGQHGNTNTEYALFDNGIMLSSDQTGTHALWGAIGDAWAGQGLDAGPLGLPVNEEYQAGNLLRVDFQFGYITFDPATGAIDIQLN